MLVSNPRNKLDLLERTRQRNDTIWTPLDWGGVMAPLSGDMEILNALHRPMVEAFIAETEELFAIKEYQRDKASEQGQREVEQDRLLADEKMAAEREVLAIRLAVEEYVHQARLYDARVRATIQAAREYAAEVEREEIGLERSRARLAIAKEQHRLKEITALIYEEYYKRAMVEADLARAKLDVLKAHTRVIMAGIEERKAEVQLIEAELQEAMVVADRATLLADIAMIFAEIVVKGLSEIKLAVETAEIEAGFEWIQQKLTDLLNLWDIRVRTELLRSESEARLQQEIALLLSADKRERDLTITAQEADEEVFSWEVSETQDELVKEQVLADRKVEAREHLAEVKQNAEHKVMARNTWAKLLVNAAQRYVHKHHVRKETLGQDVKLYIEKG